jgi:phosphatidylserine decarboxylase
MKIYNRQNKSYESVEQYGAGKLYFLYNNAFGRIILKFVILPFVSKIYGKINSRRVSIKKIPGFIKKLGIDMNDYEDCNYGSFNDFFYS